MRVLAWIPVIATCGIAAPALTAGIPSSPYPIASCGVNAGRTLFVWNDSATGVTADDIFTVTTLQGVTSRTCPSIYKTSPGTYDQWLGMLVQQYGVQTQLVANASTLVEMYASKLTGYVLANIGDNSTAVAYNMAAAMDVIAVTVNNQAMAEAAGLQQVADVRQQDISWVLDTYNDTNGFIFNSHIAALQDPSKNGFVGDYTAFAGGVFWWDTSMTSALSSRVLGSLQGPAAIFGWGVAEDQTVEAASSNGAYVHASDWAKDLSVLSNYRGAQSPRMQPVKAVPARRGSAVHTVTFLMTDGDNVQWLLGGMTSNPNWWGSPDRGGVPLGWTLTPALEDLASVVLDFMYSTASRNASGPDYFVCAPSGLGYTYPDMLDTQSLAAFTALTSAYMERAGMRIVNVLGENYETAAVAAFTNQSNVDAVIWYDYSSYSALQGNITFINGKPVVGGRFQLWTGTFESPQTLLQKLLAMPAEPNSPSGYSLIPVHVWSNNVTDVKWVADALNAHGGFDVVTPDVFMQRISANIPHFG